MSVCICVSERPYYSSFEFRSYIFFFWKYQNTLFILPFDFVAIFDVCVLCCPPERYMVWMSCILMYPSASQPTSNIHDIIGMHINDIIRLLHV